MLPRLLALLWLIGLFAGTARADVSEARKHYERGTALYDLQRYGEAAKEYELAFEQQPDAALLFNLGQAYRLAHQYASAIGAFRSYLRRMPDAPNRPEVEGRIAELQRLVDEQNRTQHAARLSALPRVDPPRATSVRDNVTVSDSRAKGRTLKIAGAAVFGAGALALGLGGAMAALASDAAHDLNHPASGRFDAGAEDRRNTYQASDIACFAIGGAALVAGAAVFAVGWRRSHRFVVSAGALSGGNVVITGGF